MRKAFLQIICPEILLEALFSVDYFWQGRTNNYISKEVDGVVVKCKKKIERKVTLRVATLRTSLTNLGTNTDRSKMECATLKLISDQINKFNGMSKPLTLFTF